MLDQNRFKLADLLSEALHNNGCCGERRDVKYALAVLPLRDKKLLAKLLDRQIKRDEQNVEEE